MKNREEPITIIDRIFTAIMSVFLMFLTCFLFIFLFGGLGTGGMLFTTWYWKVTLLISAVAGLVGFILGSSRMSEVFGYLWQTNKSKDGNWL
jgi:hypothetical protein